MADDRADVALVLRRAGLATTGADVDAATTAGYAATVDAVVASLAPGADPAADAVAVPDLTVPPAPGTDAAATDRKAYTQQLRQQATALVQWWVQRMIVARQPAAEKLAWFWHGHFATSIDKVKVAALMYRQHQIFRQQGTGDFTALDRCGGAGPGHAAVARRRYRRGGPSERELRARAHGAVHARHRQLQRDRREGGGARRSPGGRSTGARWRSSSGRGSTTGARRRSSGRPATSTGSTRSSSSPGPTPVPASSPPACGRATCWPVDPADPIVTDLAAAWSGGRRADALLHAVLTHPQFATDATRQGLVKQPVEWAIGAVRAFGLAPDTVVAGKVTVATATTRVLDRPRPDTLPAAVGRRLAGAGGVAQHGGRSTEADLRAGDRVAGAGHGDRPGPGRRRRPARPPGLAPRARRVAPGDGGGAGERGRRPRHPRHVRAHLPRLRTGLKELRWPCPDAPS